jgi:hypothetical protein
VIKASVLNDKGEIVATGFAQEDKSSSYINKTSYVENCETSAWGRALANLGIGIDTSIASSNEVAMAIAKDKLPTKKADKPTTESKPTLKTLTKEIKEKMIQAVADGKKEAVEKALLNYKCTAKVRKEIIGY